MIVLLAWIVALVVAGLILGIVGFGVTGQLARLRRTLSAARGEVEPRAVDLVGQLPGHTSAGRHSVEHPGNNVRPTANIVG